METGYQRELPEGGWGYLITLAVFIAHFTTVLQLSSFGLIHGPFLASINSETTGTTTTTAVFMLILSLAALLTGYLLGKYSYRTVGTFGAICHLLGSILLIFVTNLIQFIICVGILQGFGTGLILPTVFSSLNDYFHKKLNLMTGIAQIGITVATIVHPPAMAFCVETIGYKNTKILLACISTLNFFAMWTLHPVEWHMKNKSGKFMEKSQDDIMGMEKPFLNKLEKEKINSLVENQHRENTSQRMFDISLLKSPKYLSIASGMALTFTADNMFTAMLGMVLRQLEFSTLQIATITMVFFGSDLLARIILAIVSALYPIRNRYVFFAAAVGTAIFRIVFILRDDYIWRMANLAILGFIRCFIQTPSVLVIAESYKDNFPSALTLSTVIGGGVSLLLGPIMNIVKQFSSSADMIIQVLTGAILLTVTMWSIEFGYTLLRKKGEVQLKT